MSRRRTQGRQGITRRGAAAGLAGGLVGAAALAASPARAGQAPPALTADGVAALDGTCAITLPPGTDRAFMQADGAASWLHLHGRADPQTGYYAGWTQARRRVLADWSLQVDGSALPRAEAGVTVTPLRTVRHWPERGVTESCWLVPGAAALVIEVGAPAGTRLGLEPVGGGAATGEMLAVWQAQDPAGGVFGRFIHRNDRLEMLAQEHVVAEGGALLVFIHADTVADLAPRAIAVAEAMASSLARPPASAAPAERAAQIAAATSFEGDSDFARALQWTQATLGQLTSTQQGAGLYAGLPWFDDFWGRDTFISFIGTYLIPGRFDDALAVLQSFARLQDTDPASRTFGRIPNRARPDEIIYNTADGTPRWVASILDYLRYGGSPDAVRPLWPAVRRALEGALTYWVDADGLMTHDDADTWMDAKENGTRPFSPRGNRACDIQALWFAQLAATAILAEMLGDQETQAVCQRQREKLLQAFEPRFVDPGNQRMADAIAADGTADWRMRPNQLFALNLVSNPVLGISLARKAWRALAYPWGVASLAQTEADFHPWHEPEGLWHKDEAYHNGTIWLWLNGIACQRLFEHGEVEAAFALIQHWAGTALSEGSVGCQPELRDALPRAGASEGRPSGTWQQAWSGAELVRVVRECMLGVTPASMATDDRPAIWTLAPRLPADCPDFSEVLHLGPDSIYRVSISDQGGTCRLEHLSGPEVLFMFDEFPRYPVLDLSPRQWTVTQPDLRPGQVLVMTAQAKPDRLIAANERMRAHLPPVAFCQPIDPEDTPVVKAWRARQLPGAPAVSGENR